MSEVDAAAIGAAVRQLLGDTLGYLYPASLRVAVQARVADQLAGGPLPAERLAEAAGMSADHLRRVLRLLATRGIFGEDEDGRFHLTTPASLLRADSPVPVAPLVLLFTDEIYWAPAGRLDDTVRAGTTVYPEIFGAQIFDHLATDPERAALFSDAMACMSATEQGVVVDSCPFPEKGTVVDVGGGLGGFLRTVLTRHEDLHGVLFDRAPVLARHRLDDPAVAGRWETAAGDFYADLPAGADIYVLKRILHDKSDADCVRLLRTCRTAMPGGARLLIVDPLAPSDGDWPPSTTLSDVLMMAVFEGRERDREELSDLLAEAGLSLARVFPTPGALTVVEAVPA